MAENIVRINENTYSIEDNGVRCFLLIGQDKALLIDSGMTIKDILSITKSLTDKEVELINTHADKDHVGCNYQFDKFYMSLSEASNYYNSQKQTGVIVPVEQGDIIDLGNRKVKIVSLAGHTPGSIGILDLENRFFFTGDPIQDSKIFMFGVQRELHAYLQSLYKAKDMANEYDLIFPSHGTCPIKADIIDGLIEGTQKVLNKEIEGEDFVMFNHEIRKCDIGVASLLLDK